MKITIPALAATISLAIFACSNHPLHLQPKVQAASAQAAASQAPACQVLQAEPANIRAKTLA